MILTRQLNARAVVGTQLNSFNGKYVNSRLEKNCLSFINKVFLK